MDDPHFVNLHAPTTWHGAEVDGARWWKDQKIKRGNASFFFPTIVRKRWTVWTDGYRWFRLHRRIGRNRPSVLVTQQRVSTFWSDKKLVQSLVYVGCGGWTIAMFEKDPCFFFSAIFTTGRHRRRVEMRCKNGHSPKKSLFECEHRAGGKKPHLCCLHLKYQEKKNKCACYKCVDVFIYKTERYGEKKARHLFCIKVTFYFRLLSRNSFVIKYKSRRPSFLFLRGSLSRAVQHIFCCSPFRSDLKRFHGPLDAQIGILSIQLRFFESQILKQLMSIESTWTSSFH